MSKFSRSIEALKTAIFNEEEQFEAWGKMYSYRYSDEQMKEHEDHVKELEDTIKLLESME